VRRRHRASWDKFVTNIEHKTYKTEPRVYKILIAISKVIQETAKIQGNIDKNVFFSIYKKLRNTTNINESKLEWNSIM